MSHIHNICGNNNAAAEYQAYLARLGAARRARREQAAADNPGVRTFDSAIDPNRDGERERDGETEGEAGEQGTGEPGADGEGGAVWHGQA
jgi:hypothetical protein